MSYCMYLRKSRKDLELERLQPGSTLARHESILCSLAKSLTISVQSIYREVGSGDTIQDRPVMQQLLTEVEKGLWEGVLVMEIERLARAFTFVQRNTHCLSGDLIHLKDKPGHDNVLKNGRVIVRINTGYSHAFFLAEPRRHLRRFRVPSVGIVKECNAVVSVD